MAEQPKKEVSRADNRPKRVPLGQRNRLSFSGLDPAFSYRVINDQDDRLKKAMEAGYQFVESDEELGDTRVGEGGSIDTRVSKPVGNGVRGFLMRIPKEFYEEDQAAKISAIEETEKAMKPNEKAGQYGEGLTKT